MRGNSALAARIARLEARTRPKRLPIQPLMTVYDRDDEITAIAGWSGAICYREAGEAPQAFKTRARAALEGTGWLHAIYPAETLEPTPVATVPVPEPEPTPKPDPFALAGIGRVGPSWRTSPADEW